MTDAMRDVIAARLAEMLPRETACEVAALDDVPAALYAEELELVESAVAKRRREFAAGRHCARSALARIGIGPRPILRRDDRAPAWPEGVVGSISHSEAFCCAVVARSDELVGVGVDIESAEPLPEKLADAICRPEERQRIAPLPPLPGSNWEKLLFSAKESIYKCYRPLAGRFLDFHEVSLVIRCEAPHARRGSFAVASLHPDRPWPFAPQRLQGRWCLEQLVLTAAFLPADTV